jgi:large subunit GTPase 1
MDRFQHHHLSIPRKPAWSTAMTAEQIDRNEKDAFLQWRRSLASLENNQYSQTNGNDFNCCSTRDHYAKISLLIFIVTTNNVNHILHRNLLLAGLRITPYEKNIEVWRQLWRVLERCDIAIQIVDGRNPLLY